MKPLNIVATLAAATFSLASLTAITPVDAKEIIIKFSHTVATLGHPKGEAAILFADRVNTEMAGKVRIKVFPNSQLYNDNKVLEALLLGDVQMAAPSLSKFEQFTLKYRVFDLPFLFKDMGAVDRFQKSPVGEKLKDAMLKQGLKGLAWWHNGMKQLSAGKPLYTPSDAKGLKFRIMTSDVLKAQFEAVGASPQKMAFKEVFGALQMGVVDGQENTWSNIYTKKFYEVQDGITETNHGVLDYLVVTSVDFWDSLPADIRKQLEQILHEVSVERNAISDKINLENKEKIIAAGTVVRQITPEQRQAWVDAMKPVWAQFENDIGVDIINAAVDSNNSPSN